MTDVVGRFTFTDRVRPICQLGVGEVRVGNIARWDSHEWDDPVSTWSGDEPSWVDVTCEQFRFECAYGRQASTDRFTVGTATLLARNVSGWADPHHVDDVVGVSMRPGQQMRVGVEHVEYGVRWLFRGYIDAIRPQYQPPIERIDTVQFDLIDALGEVNRVELAGLADAPAERADARIWRLLNLAGWSGERRRIDPTSFGIIASPVNGQVADLLSQTADSAGGSLFGNHEAEIVFRGHDWQTYHPDDPPASTIGNVDPDDLCPAGWMRPFDRASIATRAIFGRDFDTARVYDDPTGIAMYGVEPFARTDLLTSSDAELDALAGRVLKTRAASTAPRVRAVDLDARFGDEYVDLMSTVDVFEPTRYRCRLQLPRGLVFDDEYFATGVQHVLDAHSWTLTLNLDLSAPYIAYPGNWDGAYWDQTTWSDVGTALTEARRLLARLEHA